MRKCVLLRAMLPVRGNWVNKVGEHLHLQEHTVATSRAPRADTVKAPQRFMKRRHVRKCSPGPGIVGLWQGRVTTCVLFRITDRNKTWRIRWNCEGCLLSIDTPSILSDDLVSGISKIPGVTAFSNFLQKRNCQSYGWNIWKTWVMTNSTYHCSSKKGFDTKNRVTVN